MFLIRRIDFALERLFPSIFKLHLRFAGGFESDACERGLALQMVILCATVHCLLDRLFQLNSVGYTLHLLLIDIILLNNSTPTSGSAVLDFPFGDVAYV